MFKLILIIDLLHVYLLVIIMLLYNSVLVLLYYIGVFNTFKRAENYRRLRIHGNNI